MNSTRTTRKAKFSKDIFVTGRYIPHFNPDDRWNPFSKIYKQKKVDTLRMINASQGEKAMLDVGGGMGRLSFALAESPENKIVLMDVSLGMLKQVTEQAKRFNNIVLVNGDAHHLPFPDRSFQYVVGLDLFCHLEKPEKALSEFSRVLMDHGTLILDSTNSNPLWTLFYPRYLGKNPLNWLRTMKFHGVAPGWEAIVKHYPRKIFFSILNEMGFQVVRTINYGPIICPKWHLAVSKKIT
jgi:glycogen(starch) synthase